MVLELFREKTALPVRSLRRPVIERGQGINPEAEASCEAVLSPRRLRATIVPE